MSDSLYGNYGLGLLLEISNTYTSLSDGNTSKHLQSRHSIHPKRSLKAKGVHSSRKESGSTMLAPDPCAPFEKDIIERMEGRWDFSKNLREYSSYL